jgi:hypothetical protein
LEATTLTSRLFQLFNLAGFSPAACSKLFNDGHLKGSRSKELSEGNLSHRHWPLEVRFPTRFDIGVYEMQPVVHFGRGMDAGSFDSDTLEDEDGDHGMLDGEKVAEENLGNVVGRVNHRLELWLGEASRPVVEDTE